MAQQSVQSKFRAAAFLATVSGMTKRDVLAELAAMGTAQNRKVYGRHGVVGAQYGVSFTNLAKLRKRIKTDQALA